MTIAYSYIRFSKRQQAKGDSYRRQTEMVNGLIEREGWQLDTSLTLQDLGVSAWKGKNADVGTLAEFLKLCQKRVIKPGSVLVVERLDRLTRNDAMPALSLFLQILQAGVSIATVEPDRLYTPQNKDPLPLIEVLIIFATNNEHSEKLSSRLRALGKQRRKERTVSNRCPMWIHVVDGKYELIPANAAVIKRIVDMAIDGMGAIRITKQLNQEKVPPIGGKCDKWTQVYITKILKTPALIGQFTPSQTTDEGLQKTTDVWENYYPAVITKDKFYRLKAATSQRLRVDKNGRACGLGGAVGERVSNLFSGLLKSGRDGYHMERCVKDFPRLISACARAGQTDGDTQTFPYDAVEQSVISCFHHEISLSMLLGKTEKPTDDPLPALRGELAETEQTIRQTKDRIKGNKKVSIFLDLLSELETKKLQLQEAIETAQAATASKGGESVALSDLQAVENVLKASKQDRSMIQARLKQLVESMTITIHGVKRKPWKLADVEMTFRSGTVFYCRIVTYMSETVEVTYWTVDGKGPATDDYDSEALAYLAKVKANNPR